MDEDEFEYEVKNNKDELEQRSYKSSRYIKEYFSSQAKLTEFLFDKNIISYKSIADVTGLTEVLVRNTVTKATKNPEVSVRRAIHIFFNKDYYEELGKYATLCEKCTKRACKQYYFAHVRCRNYKEK